MSFCSYVLIDLDKAYLILAFSWRKNTQNHNGFIPFPERGGDVSLHLDALISTKNMTRCFRDELFLKSQQNHALSIRRNSSDFTATSCRFEKVVDPVALSTQAMTRIRTRSFPFIKILRFNFASSWLDPSSASSFEYLHTFVV